MGTNDSDEGDQAVLFVDTGGSMADEFERYTAREPGIDATTVTTLPDSGGDVDVGAFDCLVVNAEPLGLAGHEFVADRRSDAPECPLILLTQQGTDDLPDSLVDSASSIVETPDERDNWRFLVEKIRSPLPTAESTRRDPEMYRLLVESARDGLYRLDANGDIVYLNESFADMLGYDRSELLGVHGSEAMADGELERGQRVVQQLIEDDDSQSDIMDMQMTTRDGETIVVSVHFVVLTTEDGAYDGIVGVVRDVTERRERQQRLERQNERLEEFASVVSHDLRNPLNVAEGRLELARAGVDSDHLGEIADAHARMRELIDDLLALARSGQRVRELESIALSDLVEQCWEHVEAPAATLDVETALTVRADRARLKRLLENLLRNAVDHGGEAVHVVVGDLESGSGFYVADDGPGIPERDRERVLDAGYSTARSGTGFGLSIVEDLVEAHDWTITVTDSDASGARFEISGVDRRGQ